MVVSRIINGTNWTFTPKRMAVGPMYSDTEVEAYEAWEPVANFLEGKRGSTRIQIDYDIRSKKYLSYLTWTNIEWQEDLVDLKLDVQENGQKLSLGLS